MQANRVCLLPVHTREWDSESIFPWYCAPRPHFSFLPFPPTHTSTYTHLMFQWGSHISQMGQL